MHRLLAGVMVLALAGLLARAQDRPPAKDKGSKDKESKKEGGVKSLQKELQAEAKEIKTPQDQAKVRQKYVKRFLEYAEKNPKAADQFDALIWVLRLSQGKFGKDTPGGKSLALIAQGYAKSDKIIPWLGVFSQQLGVDAAGVLRAVMEQHPDKKVRARAGKGLVKAYDQQVWVAEVLKTDKEKRAQYEKQNGKEAAKELLDNEDRYKKEARQTEKKLGKYADLVPVVGHPLPKVTSETLDGKKAQVGDYKGKVVVIDVWATWCGPCRAMIPHERGLVKRLKGKPFVLVSVSADEKKETVTDFLKKPGNEMPWTHWWTGNKGGVLDAWGIESFPTIFVLDAKGVIRYEDVRGEEMDKAVDTLLKEMGVKVEAREETKEGKKEEKKEEKKEKK